MTARDAPAFRHPAAGDRHDGAGVRPGEPLCAAGHPGGRLAQRCAGRHPRLGDLHLHPHDAAKLGYLWLNQGVWDGKQIVPCNGSRSQSRCRSEYPDDETITATAGGSSAERHLYRHRAWRPVRQACAALNVIVTTTGGGFDYDEIDALLTATLVTRASPCRRTLTASPILRQPSLPSPSRRRRSRSQPAAGGTGNLGQDLRVGAKSSRGRRHGLEFDDFGRGPPASSPAGTTRL